MLSWAVLVLGVHVLTHALSAIGTEPTVRDDQHPVTVVDIANTTADDSKATTSAEDSHATVLSEELCTTSQDMERLELELSLKEQEVIHLSNQLERLRSHEIGAGISEDGESEIEDFLADCSDVADHLHMRERGSCIHLCWEPDSCSDGVLSCAPYNNCIVKCEGHHSCAHLRIDYIDGPLELSCPGFGSCIGVQIISWDFYEGDDDDDDDEDDEDDDEDEDEDDGEWLERYVIESKEDFTWYLPSIDIGVNESVAIEWNEENVFVSPYSMLIKGVVTDEWMARVMQSANACIKAHEWEHREFGTTVYELLGHEVIFMDDCIDEEVFQYFRRITWGLLNERKKFLLKEMEKDGIDVNDTSSENVDRIIAHVSEHWLYDWQSFLAINGGLDSRVIEYIQYQNDGNLGWHPDNDSNFTMVCMLSSNKDFTGGESHFKLNDLDENHYDVLMDKGDVIVFPSLTLHQIDPVPVGERHVQVMEWWPLGRDRDPERTEPEDRIAFLQGLEVEKSEKKKAY